MINPKEGRPQRTTMRRASEAAVSRRTTIAAIRSTTIAAIMIALAVAGTSACGISTARAGAGSTRDPRLPAGGMDDSAQTPPQAATPQPTAAPEPPSSHAQDEGEQIDLPLESEEEVLEDYDPWEPFNERMFWVNHDVLDRFVLKPVATVWDKVLPELIRRGLGRGFDNLEMPRRLVNNLLQGELEGAGHEAARFLVNSTVGVGGVIDVAQRLGIEKSDADTGQTLGVYGFGPGPYLVLPSLPPLTVRDGIGYAVDGALDPVSYFLPFLANRSMSVGKAINERSLNLQLFADVEDSVLDLYSAARNAYLQRRRKAIEERRAGGKKGDDGSAWGDH